eukprot:CAMPEP_0198577510 /NCGR_PEP_ID=MMETSP1462-20131121/118990_1 /TAXON_ID=1333877 /ORGANISM="Brandtodinium nutriculum, Strain RCC3387" /LENGTH=774 /DNA_ID=CAMNT_0044308793 /DNA_START=33 /DNA_END=2354 /DNA_ORIENTATION=-
MAKKLDLAASAMFQDRGGSNTHKALEKDRAVLIALLAERGDGSFMRGWRRELDPDGTLVVSFSDFLTVATKLSYFGDCMGLFAQGDSVNTMTLAELHPEHGGLLNRFQAWVKAEFGDPLEWFKWLDSDGTGEVPYEDFAARCTRRGFESTAEELRLIWEICDHEADGSLALGDVVFLELDPIARSQQLFKVKLGKMIQWRQQTSEEFIKHLEEMKKEGAGKHKAHRKAPRAWMERYFETMPTVACYAKQMRAIEAKERGKKAYRKLCTHMRRTYVQEVRAFRRAMNPYGCELTPMQLRSYCSKHGLTLHTTDLWRHLDADNDGSIKLEEFSIHNALLLGKFFQWAKVKYGSCAAIWKQPEAAATSRKMTGTWFSEKAMQASVFRETLRVLEWPEVDNDVVRKAVFNCLDLNGFGMIGLGDLQWLDTWRPADWVFAQPDPAEWEKLRALLIKLYGHLLRAWRALLDRDDSNMISWVEFRDACKRIKFDGNTAAVWRVLDDDLSGVVTMKEYDLESFGILNSFKDWAELHFGSINHAFKQLDEDKSGTVSFKELRGACRKLHWTGDVRVLFDCLDVGGGADADGKRSLALKEVAFLDKWQNLPEEEVEDDDDSTQAEKPLKVTTVPAALVESTERLASPINIHKLGFTDWRSASMSSLPPAPLGRTVSSFATKSSGLCKAGSLPKLPPSPSSPYGEKLWGREISGMTKPPQRWRKDAGGLINAARTSSKIARAHGIDVHRDPTGLPQFDGTRRAFSHRLSGLSDAASDDERPGSSP